MGYGSRSSIEAVNRSCIPTCRGCCRFRMPRSRAAKMLKDDMDAMGPVRLRDVDEAQVLLVNLAKDLAAKGEIIISKQRGDEELIY